MGERRLGMYATVATAVAVVIAIVTVAIIQLVGSGNGGGIGAFNTCIRGTPYLALEQHRREHGVLETISDRTRGAVVGEVATNDLASTPLGGAAAADDGYLMSTVTPSGRDASAIETCWDGPYPPAPRS